VNGWEQIDSQIGYMDIGEGSGSKGSGKQKGSGEWLGADKKLNTAHDQGMLKNKICYTTYCRKMSKVLILKHFKVFLRNNFSTELLFEICSRNSQFIGGLDVLLFRHIYSFDPIFLWDLY